MTQPQNTNFQQPTRFLLTFPRISNTQYFCQTCNLPGISLVEIAQPTMFANLYHPSNKPIFQPFTATFIVDEALAAWIELFLWINGLAPSKDFTQYQNLSKLNKFTIGAHSPIYADGTLQILTALNNAKIHVDFTNMFPTTLTSVEFDSKAEGTPILTSTITLRYDYFTMRVDPVTIT